MSTRLKLVIGASVFTAAFAAFLMIDLTDTETSKADEFSGDYRVIASGEWSDAEVWEKFDGTNWVAADEAPGKAANSIVVSEGSELVVTEEASATRIVIEKGGKLILSTNTFSVFKAGGKGGVFCKGVLDMDECILDGNGDFILHEEAVLHIGSPEGLDKRSLAGNIQLRGAVNLDRKATYIFDGSVRQSVGNGMPVGVESFIVSNTSGVFMQSDLSVNKLILESGTLYTGPHVLKIGTSVNASGGIKRVNGMLQGTVQKWYGQDELESIVFPVGDEGGKFLFSFKTEEPAFRRGFIELKYHPGKPDDGFVSPFAAKEIKVGITEFGYFTAKFSNGPDEALLESGGSTISPSGENVSRWILVSNEKGSDNSVMEERNMDNFLLGPNPFTSGFTLTFTAGEPTLATMQLVNRSGKVVHTETIPVEQGKNKYNFTEGNEMPSGNYIVRISNPMEIHTVTATKK